MPAPFQIAQTPAPGTPPVRTLRIEKPADGQAVTFDAARLGKVQFDLSAVADENITLVRVGDTLVILFDNQSTVTIAPFYADGVPLADLSIQLGADRVVTALDFAKLFPISDDQTVLPAAGGPKSGAFFTGFTINDLAGPNDALSLLGNQGDASAARAGEEPDGEPNTVPVIGTPEHLTTDDGALAEGNLDSGDSPGDAPATPASVTGSLDVDFGLQIVGRSLSFAASQPGLTGLFSGGQPVTVTLATINGLPGLIGHTGNPNDPVFLITLDIAPLAGAYNFTLLRPLDHPIAGEEDDITISIAFTATDGNGDAAHGVFNVTIDDDSPRAEAISATMSENQTLTVDFIEGTEFSFGADLAGPGGLTFGNLTVENVPNGLTFDAQQIQSLFQFAADQISLSPGTTFDQLGVGESVTLRLPYSLTDGDGDSAASDIVITVNGENDAPAVTTASLNGAITEDRPSAPNAIVDGGFEGGDAGAWTGDFISFGSGFAHTGALAALVFVPGSLHQTLQTVAGQDYTLDFWVNEFGFTGSLSVVWNGTPVGDFTFGGGTVYQPYSIDLTGIGTAADLEFVFGGGPWSLLVDDVSMQATLAPFVQTAGGTIDFTDADLNDTHTASFIPQNGGGGYLGDFSLAPIVGASGVWSLDWDFTVDRADLQFLGEGQSVQQFYDVTISDGNGGVISETVAITLTGTNDAPVLAGFGNTQHFGEQGPAVVINGSLDISDIDSATLSGATVSITGNFQPGADVLGFTNQNGITGIYNDATGVLTLSGTATLAEYQAALQSVTFQNTSNGPAVDPRTIDFQVNDGASEDNLSNLATSTVTIGPVNDPPTITSAPVTLNLTEDFSNSVPLGERITNGSFESPNFGGWTNSHFVALGAAHTGSGSVGTGAAQLSDQPTGTLSQTINTVAGVTYQISFWASNPFDAPGFEVETLTVTWGGLTALAVSNVPASGSYQNFTHYTVQMVATAPTTELVISMTDTWGWWNLDDVSVTAVITPGIEVGAGTVTFSDPDVADTHTVTVTASGTNYFGDFNWTLQDSTGTGSGAVNWDFTVDDADIQHLGAGQSLTQTYTVEIDDGNGGVASQDVTVVIHGENDAPAPANDTIVINGYTGSAPGTAASTPIVNEAAGNNNNRANAQVLDRDALKIAPNGNLGDESLPSITIKGAIAGGGDGGTDFYRIELKAGETIILDIDGTTGSLDSLLRIWRLTGSSLATNDDSSTSLGGAGSTSSLDSYLTYTATQDGFYYIEATRFSGTGNYDLQVSIENFQGLQGPPVSFSADLLLANDHDVDDGDTFQVVSVSGTGVTFDALTNMITVQPSVASFSYTIEDIHGAQSSATATVQQLAGSTVAGTSGGDILIGSAAADTLIGERGSDVLHGGAGSDTFRWVAGDLDGGGVDQILDFASGPTGDIIDIAALLAGIAGNKADHVRFEDVNGNTRLASAGAGSTLADGDLTLQINLTGGDWTDVAVIHDTGSNLDGGDNVLRMLLDASVQNVVA